MTEKKAIQIINQRGALLVFPLQNRQDPKSLWSEFFPRSKMRWEWDNNGDSRVADLWHLREELSRSEKVVYTKWFSNRATFFSKDLFTQLLAQFMACTGFTAGLGEEATELLQQLELSSPLSTKQLKQAANLQGKFFEPAFHRGMKQLWMRLLIVGFGEVDDGAFPSLAAGATAHLFEPLWREAERKRNKTLSDPFEKESASFSKFYRRVLAELEGNHRSL